MKAILLIVAVFIVITFAGLAWVLLGPSTNDSVLPKDESDVSEMPVTFEATIQSLYNNAESNFSRGYQASLRGDSEEAITFFKAALAEQHNPIEEAHIKYRLAREYDTTDPTEEIRLLKEITDNPSYPDEQKKYAVMWIPIIILSDLDNDSRVLGEALKGTPYETFEGEDLNETLQNFYGYSLTFGSTGVAEFAVAEYLAKNIRDNIDSDELEIATTKARIAQLMQDGRTYIKNAQTDPRNAFLLPRIFRAQARANALMAQLGDEYSINSFDVSFLEAINQGLASKLDGAVRWDYFRYSYEIFGADSFEKTQSHLDFLLANLNTYTGIRDYLISERNDILGTKEKVIEYANVNVALKNKLIELGWSESDFR